MGVPRRAYRIKMEIRRIVGIAFIILGIILLSFSSIQLILTKLSLPPYSTQTEGRYVAYSLQVYVFLFLTLPLVASLFLAGYLAFPPLFRRFYVAVRALAALLAIGGFGITALLVGSGIVNKVFPLFAVAGTSPFWIMSILATLVFKKSRLQQGA